jgi:predicted kinase
MSTLSIMVGLPGSGKSVYAEQLGVTVVSPDAFRKAMGNLFNPKAEKLVWATIDLAVRGLLIAGNDVVIDATNITKQRREPWVKMAKELTDNLLLIFVVDIDTELCKARNGIRSLPVPDSVIDRMALAFEMPTSDEGVVDVLSKHAEVYT